MPSKHLQGFKTIPARISHVRRFRAGTFIDKDPCFSSLQRGFISGISSAKSPIGRRLSCKDFWPAKTCKLQEVVA